ncbi:hypothetical protein KIW84_014611 [Lathyrus oleraceus]|uniref:Uncharacterized protein n=1 Tax=Pisum sativum TaxID=3888 RepID=A0A9D5GZJ3_PEA|nr:hypothetical protein KIW84_014611 [Pisum sativum]
MLSSLPVFFMFFYEAPKKVINEITLFQSRFLWHDTEEKKGIHWIKWSKVFKSKDEGGLGVKNFEFFNEALLLKWKWRFTQDDNIIWRDLLTESKDWEWFVGSVLALSVARECFVKKSFPLLL